MTSRWVPFAAAAVLLGPLLAPALLTLHSHFMGFEYVDHYGTQWFYWFVGHELLGGQGLGHTELFFFPFGKDIYRHTGANVLDGLAFIPFRALLGPVLGYNVFVTLGMAATGIAFYKLARDHVEHRGACAVGALLLVASPFVLNDLADGRPTQAILVFPILFLRYALRTAREPGWKSPALAGVFLALSGYMYWFYAFFCGMAVLAHGLWQASRPGPAAPRARRLGRQALMAAIGLALTAPVALPLALETASGDEEVPGLLAVDQWSMRATPPVTREKQTVGIYVWQPLRRWAGFHVLDTGGNEHLLSQGLLLPWAWAPLLLLFVWRPGAVDRGAVISMALMSMALATGSLLLIGDYALPNPLFIYLVKAVGFMQRLWWPARALVVLAILLSLMVTSLLAQLAGRDRRLFAGASIGLASIWCADLYAAGLMPLPTWDATIPAGYRCLAGAEEGAIIELPHGWTQAHLYYQTEHHRPIMGGMLENNPVFTPPGVRLLWEENTFLSELHKVALLKHDEPEWEPDDRDAVATLGYRYVVLQKDALDISRSEARMGDHVQRFRLRRVSQHLRKMLGPPVYSDIRIDVYAPWGAERPCGDEIAPDTVLRGPTEVAAETRIIASDRVMIIRRVFMDPDSGPEEPSLEKRDEAASGDAETPDAETPDAETPDAETPDAETPDAETPDAETPTEDAGTDGDETPG